ncbi:MAG: TonB-dependent receptor [Bacteroidetes bacterium]|nr:TonB-dependent receptor [Bacteroidota bacterium]
MRKFITLLLPLIFVLQANAQTFQIAGKIVSNENIAVEFANVILFQNNAIVQATISDHEGKFKLNAEKGDYTLFIHFLSDTLFVKNINLNANLDLGMLQVEKKIKLLQEVVFEGKQNLIERKADRLVFNATNLPTADGGDLLDILKATPSLIVDSDNISIIGKGGVLVMIDNRIVQLSGNELMNYLKGFSANDIQSVEVITTPPAKYSAEGNSGLLNIVLKKTPNNTWSASVFGSYTQTRYAAGSIGGSFNYRKNRFSFYTNASYNPRKTYMDDETIIHYPEIKWLSKGNYTRLSHSANFRTGFDVDITNRWLVGAMYMGNFGVTPKSENENRTTLFDMNTGTASGLIETAGHGNSQSFTHSANLHSTIKADTLGTLINFDFDFINFNTNSNNTFASTTTNSQYIDIPNGFFSQNRLLDRNITNYSAQIEVEQPIKRFNLNYGARVSFSRTNNDISIFDLSSGNTIEDLGQSNQFLYKENIQAIWISSDAHFGNEKWLAQVGLRGENTQFTGNSVTMDTTFKNSYFELFPTAYLSYNMNQKNVFYLEYGRRISRPNFSQLNPFRSYSSPYYYFVGNPELKPTISNNVTLGYIFNNIFQTGLFFEYTKNSQGGGIVLIDPNGFTQVGTRLNYLDSYDLGVGVVYIFNKLKWWTSQNGINAWYYKAFSNIYPLTPKTMEGVGANFQTYNIFYLNKKRTIQAGFDFTYSPPQIVELTYSYQRFNLNAFYKMLFFASKLSVTLQANNILREYSFNTKSERSGIMLYSKGYYDPLHFRLALSYNFGSNNINIQQRQNSNEEEKGRL